MSTDPTLPDIPVPPPSAPVSEAAVQAALKGSTGYHRAARRAVWTSPSSEEVRAMLEAAAPLIRAEAEAKLAMVREYRVFIAEEDDEIILSGWCAESIGCLFQRNYDAGRGVTLGALIDAALEHEGEQGERAHARVAEINGEAP